jgi:hypothetical protein
MQCKGGVHHVHVAFFDVKLHRIDAAYKSHEADEVPEAHPCHGVPYDMRNPRKPSSS